MKALETQLERMKHLLAHGAMDSLFANPTVTPEPKWFPDRWTADPAAVRHLLLRLAEYAGLASLEIEVAPFQGAGLGPGWLPQSLESSQQTAGAAGLYFGTEAGTAYFGVHNGALGDPDHLLGVLSHEMAHAWRKDHGLAEEDRQLEEELTDLTGVVLGFGILTANAAYQYKSSGEISGVMATTRWSHQQAGYLPVETMAGLVAIRAVARGEDLRRVRGFLQPTQASCFDEALKWLRTIDIEERLSLPPGGLRPACRSARATARTFSLSRVETSIHREIESLVAQLGDDGGILTAPSEFGIDPVHVGGACILAWGRATVHGGWYRQMYLVRDPLWATNAVVVAGTENGTRFVRAVGHLGDKVCSRRNSLRDALAPLFLTTSPSESWLAPGVPGCVLMISAATLGAGEAESLFSKLMKGFDPTRVARETRHLETFGSAVMLRLDHESGVAGYPTEIPKWIRPPGSWWTIVSDPQRSYAEWTSIGKVPRAGGPPRPAE